MAPAPEPFTLLAALLLGLGGSIHCFAMCGPLACAALTGPPATARRRALLYHAARVAAYVAVGAVAGALGAAVSGVLGAPVQKALPWVLAVALLGAALDPGGRRLRRLPMPPGLARALGAIARVRARLSPSLQALLLGALTPLLPCALLYGVLMSAAATGGVLGGALLMGGFALGAVPALFASQLSVGVAQRSTRSALFLRLVPLCAAIVLVVRATRAALHHGCH